MNELFLQRHEQAAQDRATLLRIYGELHPSTADLIGICAELLRRGLSLPKVARLSSVPLHTLQEIATALGVELHQPPRSPVHLDACCAEPISHLQLSVFVSSVHVLSAMGASSSLDAEAFCNALRRTERGGLPIDHLMLGYIHLALEAWQSGQADLMQCACCAGSYLRFNSGSNFLRSSSARCPFCAGIRRTQPQYTATAVPPIPETSDVVIDRIPFSPPGPHHH